VCSSDLDEAVVPRANAALSSDEIAALAGDLATLNTDSASAIRAELEGIAETYIRNWRWTAPQALPTLINGTVTASWVSSNTEVVSSDGATVTRPTDSDAEVTITGTLTRGGVTGTKSVTVTVKKALTADTSVADRRIVRYEVNDNHDALVNTGVGGGYYEASLLGTSAIAQESTVYVVNTGSATNTNASGVDLGKAGHAISGSMA
jgi:hypothetical protein